MSAEDALLPSTDESEQRAGSVPSGARAAEHDELIAEVLAGDRKAIATFVETFADAVYRFLSRRIDRPEVVEELCQDVFLAAWPQLARFRGEAGLTTWLCTIARHKVADFYRRRLQEMPQEAIGDDELGAHPEAVEVIDFEANIDAEQLDARVSKVLSEMPERHRAMLRWRYWDHRSLAEIAEMTGKTGKAVERLLARSRESFARRWNLE